MTFGVFLLLWIINWFADGVGPDDARDPELSVDYRAPRRFHPRHPRHQAHRLLPELHHVRAVPDGEVGRLRAVEGLKLTMVKRILGLLGWLGVALVFAAIAIRNLRPEWTWWYGLAIAGLVCALLYVLSQWREIARDFSGRAGTLRQPRHREHRHRPHHPGGDQLPRQPAQQALGPDGGATVHAVRSDEESGAGPDQTGQRHGLRQDRGLRSLPLAARGISVSVEPAEGRVHRSREAPVDGRQAEGEHARHRRPRVRGPRAARDVGAGAGPDQRPHQGAAGHAAEGALRAGPRRAGHRRIGRRRL